MQRPLAFFEERSVSLPKDEEFVELTLYDVSASLLKEFAREVVKPHYRGLVEAFEDLMRKAVEEQRRKAAHLNLRHGG